MGCAPVVLDIWLSEIDPGGVAGLPALGPEADPIVVVDEAERAEV
jgi:hypothetical protein